MRSGRKRPSDFLTEAQQLARNGFYREALQLYQSAWSLQSDNREALYGMAACFFRLGNLRQAEYYSRILLEKAPGSPQGERLLQLIAQTQRQRGDPRRRTLLEECEERYDDEDLRGEPLEG